MEGSGLLEDEKFIKRLSVDNPSLARRIYNWISDAIAKIGKSADQQLLIMIFKGNKPDSFVLLIETIDKHGNGIVTVIHLNRYSDRMNVNRIASIYGKNNYVKANIENNMLLDID